MYTSQDSILINEYHIIYTYLLSIIFELDFDNSGCYEIIDSTLMFFSQGIDSDLIDS